MRINVCGTRGSTPSPGQQFVRYGGHTSCLALARDDDPPSLLLDAGTGIRNVTTLLEGRPFDGSILMGHLHWDHTQGLPFFRAGDNDKARVDLYMPSQNGGDVEALLERAMSPPNFPIRPSQLRGTWRFLPLEAGAFEIEGFSVVALDIPHGGGRTFGFRVSDGKVNLAYLSDHCPTAIGPGDDGLGEFHPAALELVRDCDIVFHDSQYTNLELPERAHFGHSATGYAVGLAKTAGAKELVLFHHDPWRTDDELDELLASAQSPGLVVRAGVEGAVIDLA